MFASAYISTVLVLVEQKVQCALSVGAHDAWWCVLLFFSPLPFHLDAFLGDGEEVGVLGGDL